MHNQIITLHGVEFIDQELLEKSGVPRKTIDNGRSSAKNGKSALWFSITVGGRRYFQRDRLSPKTVKKIREIPAIDNIPKDVKVDESNKASNENYILLILNLVYYNKRFWTKNLIYYKDRFFLTEELILFAKTHTLIEH